MAENTDLIKEKIPVANLVKQYVELRPAGKNLKGLCPFHGEKSPSFMVSPDRGIWHCFGCGKGGDIFGFLMQYENIEFIEALKVLADQAGVTLQNIGSADQKKYDVLYEINRIGKDYFKSSLFEPAGAPALKYLRERGLKDETIAEFELGVALPGNDSLMRHLTKMGYSVNDIERAGLAFKTERGTYWDRFRNRIMFPLHNHFGKVIGFTGRVMPGNESQDVGKYVNSPETAIFNKSKLLFGFFKSKNAVREQNTAVLVEGQMDFLMAYQDGIKNLVATSGTALTMDHLKLIRRLAENLVLSFDNDSAGKAAAERTIDLAQANDLNTKVIIFDDPALKDPADIARAKPGHFAQLIKKAVPAMEYYMSYYGIGHNQEIAAKKKAVRQMLTKIKAIASPVEQQHWLTEVAGRSGMPEPVLSAEMAMLKVEAVAGPQVKSDTTTTIAQPMTGRAETIIYRLLSLVVRDPATAAAVKVQRQLLPAAYQPILDALLAGTAQQIPPELSGVVNLIYLQSGFEPAPGEAEVLLKRLKQEGFTEDKRRIQEQIRAAERSHDEALLAKLLEEYKNLTKDR
jgi:DNA primase